MKATAKKTMITTLVMVLIIAVMLVAAIMAKDKSFASGTSLDDLFENDALAKDGIEAMRSAGLIDENGKMVALDIRENGASVELDVLANRIANGEEVGVITVNGNAVTADKVMQLQQVNSSLDVINLMDRDVEITDEHVANLKMLLEDIATGKVNLSPIISEGAQQASVNRGAPAALPANTGSGEVEATDGEYTAPYISGSTYEASHTFALNDPDNVTWYTQSSIVPTSSALELVVTLESTPCVTYNGLLSRTGSAYSSELKSFRWYNDTEENRPLIEYDSTYTDLITHVYMGDVNNTTDLGDGWKRSLGWIQSKYSSMSPEAYLVSATLSATPSVPVSFDWSAVSETYNISGDISGTIAWDANGTQLTKKFAVYVGSKPENTYWVGSQCFVINAGNVKNATFQDGKIAWNQVVSISANDKNTIMNSFPTLTNTCDTNFSAEIIQGNMGQERYLFKQIDYSSLFPSDRDEFVVNMTLAGSNTGSNRGQFYLLPGDKSIKNNSDIYNACQSDRAQVGFGSGTEFHFRKSSFSYSGVTKISDLVKNGKVWIAVHCYFIQPYVSELTVSVPQVLARNEVLNVSAPAATYYSGQLIPVTVTMKEYGIAPAGTTLTVNGVECPLLNADTLSKTFTFGYTVKKTDSGSIVATALSGTLKNVYEDNVELEGSFPATSIGKADGVNIQSSVKVEGLDWGNVKYGIDDGDPGQQVVTVVIPFKSDAVKTWIANEAEELNPAIAMSVPGYSTATAAWYLKSAYFSADDGATRYPVYVIGENADVLVARFAPGINATPYLRLDNLLLYLDTEVGTTAEYFGEEHTDAMGYLYFTATDNSAPAAMGKYVSYYAKACILFDKDATIDRANYNEANKTDGFYKEGAVYIAVQGEDYDKQHDVEFVANEALYKAAVVGARVEDSNTLILNYQVSRRDNFTFTDPKYFTWSSDNEQIATVVKNEQSGAAQIALTGVAGSVTITLTVGNGTEDKKYDLSYSFTVLEGKTPFLKISEFSRERVTLTETDTDVLFSSNLTARNAAMGANATAFTAKLYNVGAVNDAPSGDPIWTGTFESTVADTLTHITVPATQLVDAGIYAVVVSASYVGGDVGGFTSEPEDFAVTAYLNVKQAPLKVTLKTLDSYSAEYNDLPTIEYTVTPSNANVVVEYTIQKSGEAVSARTSVTDGTIPFAATKPEGLKDAYIITVYARAVDADADEAWSMDSMLLRVYNTDILELVVKDVIAGEIGGTTGGVGDNANGTTVDMDNHDKLPGYGITDGTYQLTVSDLNLLRTDMSLQKIISANYGSGVWGLISDKIQWSSSDSDLVSINYEQGGFYSDIRNYSYTSYGPATDFLLVGKDKTDGVTIKATHAATGMFATVTVTVDTLKDQLYIFQFNPKVVTDVVYTNGANQKRELKSDENGVLAVYEPEGIASAVMAMSEKDGQIYVGTIFNSELESGERDIASLQLYPCNNLRLRSVSNVTLTFLGPDGNVYNGQVTLRVGVYKNGVYCPEAKTFLVSSPADKYGARDNITVPVSGGKLTLGFNPTEFKNDPDDDEEPGAYPADKITYVIEYRIDGYKTNYVMLTVSTDSMGEQKATDSVIQLKTLKTSANVPQITRQTIRQYSDGKPLEYTRDVTDFTDYIGLSKKIDKVILTTDYALPTSFLTYENDIPSVSGEFALYTVDGRKLTGQLETTGERAADQIINLSDLENATLFVFPFSSTPFGRNVYTMTDANMTADGISDVADNATPSSGVKAMFVQDGMTLTSVTLSFGISNLSHQDPMDSARDAASDINRELKGKLSIGEIFSSINVNDMLKKGFTFLGGLTSAGGDVPMRLMILPTEDPGVFDLIALVGKKQNKGNGGDGVEVEYDVQKLRDDYIDVLEDNDTKLEASFSGTIILEAGYDFNTKEWKIAFRGGSVGAAFSAGYEWTQNFMCGPVPATVSFEVGAHAELEVSFASKASVKQMLIDATVGVSVEAFAGIGFDATIAKLKLGIYGSIGADVNFLLLSDFNDVSTGTKLTINGEIGIRLEVKFLFIEYNKTFASTGFNWTKKWNQYDAIQRQWAESGAAEIFGLTRSGRAYSMKLLSNGTALVAIESGGELEDRDYLDLGERAWNSGIAAQRGLRKGGNSNALTDVQTNAYPYSNPVFVDDGSMFLYISDNNNADELQTVVNFSVSNGIGYDEGTPIYDVTDENAILADSDVVASGTGGNIFAAWVKQMDSPEKEMNDQITNDDLGLMMNATEIYVGTYNGTAWTTTRLTDNNVADMAPTIASHGNKSIAAWRSLSATTMPASAGEQDFSSMFNAENKVNYSIYDGTTWSEATVAYNGSAGTVTAINSAMLADGTSILAYTVRTSDDVTSTETYYTVINADGDIVTTGRLTNDSYADTNAQVAAVGNQFVVGWYSEYGNGDQATHDIRLARIHTDGSVDATFPESIGVGAATDVTSDFRFSAPAGTDELGKLSIVWAQKQDSEDKKNTKYSINAMRFYEGSGAIGMTSPITIAETASNFTVDHYDTYTDADGKVHVLVLGSDYNSLEGLAEYDTIDLTNQPIETSEGSNLLTILEQNPLAYIKLGAAEFHETDVEVTADTNLKELVMGLDLPVQFTIKNVGTSTVDKVNVQFGDANKTFEGLALLPNQSTIITIVYSVPEDKVEDVDYTITVDDTAVVTETLVLNRPDVGISGMKLLSEENGERLVQVMLYNASGIPLKGSGKIVKLALYTSPNYEEEKRVGSIITIQDADALASIDDGIYSVAQTLLVEDLIGDADEIPDGGIQLYAYAWVEDCDELYTTNNGGSLSFKGLLTKSNGETITMDTAIEANTEDETTVYTVRAEIRNNSMKQTTFGIPVALLVDSEGNIIAQKNFQDTSLTLTKEQSVHLSATFTVADLNGRTPAGATVGAIYTVTFDVNGGSGIIDSVQSDLDGHIVLPTSKPTPPQVQAGEEPVYFKGWYTDATNGEMITADYAFTTDTTVYAHYIVHHHDYTYSAEGATITATCGNSDGVHPGELSATMTIVAPALTVYGGEGNPEATVTNNVDGVDTPSIVYKKGETVLDAAPTDAGTYTANITLGDATAILEYTIEKKELTITAKPKAITYGDAPANDGVTYSDDFVFGEDESILSGTLDYDYSYSQYGNVGTYAITPKGLTSDKYKIIFVPGVLTVEAKAITVTIVPKTSVYGEAQVALEATTAEGAIVNGDTGVYSLSCTVSKTSDVGSYDIIGSDDSDNYAITFANEGNAYTVTKKALTVTANAHTITYGDAPANDDVSFDGFVNDEDRAVLGGELAFAYTYEQFGHVSDATHAYTITPSGYTSGNYEITFETGVLTVERKALTVTANPYTITYGDVPANDDVSFDGFVGGDDRTVLVGELAFAYSYEQFGHVSDAEHAYIITPSGYTADNYDITFATGVLTVLPKQINVTIVAKTSIYGEAQVALEATTEEGAIVNGDTDLYSLACEVSATANVGLYDIVGTDLSDNYAITFVGEKDAYSVTKRPIVATAQDETIKYEEDLPTFRFELSETIADSVLAELKGKTAFVCDGDPLKPGKYAIVLTFVGDYTTETVLQNYAVTLEGADLYILAKTLADTSSEVGSAVEILLEDSDDAFDYGISVEIGIVETASSQESTLDYGAIQKEYVNRRSEISKVYSIKLYRTEVVDGVETIKEIQPSDIKEGMTIVVKMEIPDYLAGRNFRVLHVHSADDIEYISELNTEIKDGYVYVTVDRFSEFAFVHLKANEEMNHDSFCLGWALFILNCLLAVFYVVFFLLKRKKKLAFAGLIAACVVLAYAIIAISLHLCVITIVSFVVAVVLFGAWLTMYLLDKNKPDEENNKNGTTETSAEEEIEPAPEAQEQTQNETPAQPAETAVEEDSEDGGVVVDAKGNYFNIRYNKSFRAKLIQSSDETKGYYGELKNEVLCYSKAKSRVSWSYDSINAGRAPVVKFGIRGKTLCVYFPLNAEDYAESKYKVEKVESAKYEAVPCMYRIKNERRLRYAKELIAKVCESLGLTKGDLQNEDYNLPYETTEALIAKGLIKELKTEATATQIERARAEGTIRIVESVSADEVNDLISNEVAAAAIVKGETHAIGKKGIVNVDVLSANFRDGDTVTIERLKEKKLIPTSIGQVKLLARGSLDKALHVELQDYSIEAVKMILATGGTVKKA